MLLSSGRVNMILLVTLNFSWRTIPGHNNRIGNEMVKVTTLRDTVRERLLKRPEELTLKIIAKEAGLTFGWVQAFACGQADNPGVVYVETLSTYMQKKGF